MRLPTILSRLAGGAAVAVMGLGCARAGAPAAEVRLKGYDVRFGPRELGGVTRIVRYLVPQPDRSETDYLFLTKGETAGAPPEAVQVVGHGGELLHLADTEAADCTLEHVRIYALAGGRAEVVYAVRTFSGALGRNMNSDPATMQVSVFRTEPGRDAFDSTVVLRLAAPSRRSRLVCRLADVESEMTRLSTPAAVAR